MKRLKTFFEPNTWVWIMGSEGPKLKLVYSRKHSLSSASVGDPLLVAYELVDRHPVQGNGTERVLRGGDQVWASKADAIAAQIKKWTDQ